MVPLTSINVLLAVEISRLVELLSRDKLGVTLLSIAITEAIFAVDDATLDAPAHWTLPVPSGMRIELVKTLGAEVRS
jgi:hypothetical protein